MLDEIADVYRIKCTILEITLLQRSMYYIELMASSYLQCTVIQVIPGNAPTQLFHPVQDLAIGAADIEEFPGFDTERADQIVQSLDLVPRYLGKISLSGGKVSLRSRISFFEFFIGRLRRNKIEAAIGAHFDIVATLVGYSPEIITATTFTFV